MAAQGPNSPTAASQNNGNGGSYSWGTITNVYTSDNAYALSSVGPGGISYQVLVTGFGFSIPPTATIDGVEVSIERKKTGSGSATINDNLIKLVKNGTVSGNSKSTGATWPTSDTTATFGSSSDLWGNTLTPSDINNSNFGVAIAVSCFSVKFPATANIDHVTITVTYTDGPPPATTTGVGTMTGVQSITL